jgi:hypothetical protein
MYAYCQGDPVNFVDPGGMAVETIADAVFFALDIYQFASDPSLVNAAFLAWDIAALAIPVVPGSYVGQGLKAGTKALSKADDATKVVDDVADAINAAKKASKATKGVVALGTKFGKLGVLVKNPGVAIDWLLTTNHMMNRMSERGLTQKLIESTVKNGKVLKQGGGKYLYVSKKAVVVMDSSGRLITGYGKKYYDDNMKALVKLLF